MTIHTMHTIKQSASFFARIGDFVHDERTSVLGFSLDGAMVAEDLGDIEKAKAACKFLAVVIPYMGYLGEYVARDEYEKIMTELSIAGIIRFSSSGYFGNKGYSSDSDANVRKIQNVFSAEDFDQEVKEIVSEDNKSQVSSFEIKI